MFILIMCLWAMWNGLDNIGIISIEGITMMIWIKRFFLCFVCCKQPLFVRIKIVQLTYRRLTSFMVLFTYFRFLGTWLSGSKFVPISLVFRYKFISGSRFYETWFSTF
jgi:hypothetical protein